MDVHVIFTEKRGYFGFLPVTAEQKFYAFTGFEIPSLPALPQESNDARDKLVEEVLYRFQLYLLELHDVNARRSVALQLMAHPERATLNSKVRIYVLCQAAHDEEQSAITDVRSLADRASQCFPQSGMFNYGQPVPLTLAELQHAGFSPGGQMWPDVDLVELRKFEDRQTWSQQPALHYVPHRLWADNRLDPWLLLIEGLAGAKQPTALRIELTPARLNSSNGLDLVSSAGQWFTVIGEDLDRRSSQGEQVRNDKVLTNEVLRSGEVAAAAASAASTAYVQRGRHIYKHLVAHSDRLFGMRVTLAARGPVPESLIGSTRAALSSPPLNDPIGSIGWVRPEVVRPPAAEMPAALSNLQLMIQSRWGRTPGNPAIGRQVDLRYVVTPEEAASLFHLPVYERPGQTSALSTAETPFVIPPESLDSKKFRPGEKSVRIGYLYQREKLLKPDKDGKNGQGFSVSTSDLIKPSLLVGAPGSGKSNLAVSLLIQLWRDHGIPFLVLDPSTGQEYRLLLGEPSLKDNLIVYTAGDPEGLPLQFNPFAVPPGVSVRNHTTRILAAFRAAFSMFDPVPAIYEGALERLYTIEKYCGKGRALKMEDKGKLAGASPTLSQFATAIQDELTEKALTLYQGSAESIGVIRGASTIRVNAIGKKLGYILNVPNDDGAFFQNLLRRPAVIELGTLGDTTNIALLMAFLISQLTGHVEFASRKMAAENKRREHLILIEEAHRLLAGGSEDGVSAKSAEDLNMMLAEVRKFGQGIMILDQRPSSLVGGVLDNSYVKILTRLSDRSGFDRLSDDLNLTEAQRRFARTRLKAGDAIVLDRDAGQPVLMRAENIKDDLESQRLPPDQERDQIRDNAKRWNLTPPEYTPYVEPSLPETPKKAEKQAPVSASPQAKSRDWLVAQFESAVTDLLSRERENSVLYHGAMEKLELKEPDIAGAKSAVDAAMEADRAIFDSLSRDLWEKMKWSMVSIVADERSASGQVPKEIAEQIRELRSSAKAAAAGASVPVKPAAAATANGNRAESDPAVPAKPMTRAQRWLKPETEKLFDDLALLLSDERNKYQLYQAVKAKVLQSPPDVDGAFADVRSEMEPDRVKFEQLIGPLWEKMKWLVVGIIAEEKGATEAVKKVRQLKNNKVSSLESSRK